MINTRLLILLEPFSWIEAFIEDKAGLFTVHNEDMLQYYKIIQKGKRTK